LECELPKLAGFSGVTVAGAILSAFRLTVGALRGADFLATFFVAFFATFLTMMTVPFGFKINVHVDFQIRNVFLNLRL
jgi:hypothetical protein